MKWSVWNLLVKHFSIKSQGLVPGPAVLALPGIYIYSEVEIFGYYPKPTRTEIGNGPSSLF